MDQVPVWQQEITLAAEPFDNAAFVAQMEAKSRGEWLEVLKKAGFARREPPAKSPAGPPDTTVETRLSEMNFISQFTVVRSVHRQIEVVGESPVLLSQLARGYANLGVLTEYFWNPMQTVFKARALLYAERLVVAEKGSLASLLTRGYVRSLMGLHAAGLSDYTAASALFKQQSATERKPVPSSARLLVALCRFDTTALKQAPNPQDAQLAALIRLLAAELCETPGLPHEVAAAEILNAPECYRICDGMTMKYGHDEPDEAFEQPPNGENTFARTLIGRLKAIDVLPANVGALLDKHAGKPASPELRGQIVCALLDVPAQRGDADRSEFPWPLLGQMIEETSFIQGWRILRPDMARGNDAEYARLKPATPRHRYRGFLEMAQSDPTAHRSGYTNLLPAKDLEMLSLREYPIIRYLVGLNWQEEGQVQRRVFLRADHLPVDTGVLSKRFMFTGAKLLATVSPNAPMVRTNLIRSHWADVEPLAAEWEQSSAGHSNVLQALGKQYLQVGKLADAERLLKAAFALERDAATLGDLAEVYRRQGDLAQQIEVLKQQLEMPGLQSPAATQVLIAAAYMELGQWQAALSFAEAAAKYHDAPGLFAAADVHEVLQDWITSEERIQTAAKLNAEKPFGPDFLEWYSWSQRNGQQGDATRAHELAQHCVQWRAPYEKDAQPHNKQSIVEATFYSCTRDLPKALEVFDAEFKASADPFHGLHSALLNDRHGNTAARDVRLAAIAKDQPKWLKQHNDRPQPLLYGLVEILKADLAAGGKAEFDATALNKLVASGSEAEQLDFYYFLGEYQNIHNQLEKSIESWRECMIRLPIRAANRTLAGRALWSVGVTPQTYREALQARAGAKKSKSGT